MIVYLLFFFIIILNNSSVYIFKRKCLDSQIVITYTYSDFHFLMSGYTLKPKVYFSRPRSATVHAVQFLSSGGLFTNQSIPNGYNKN